VTFLNRQASLTHPDLKTGMKISEAIKGPFWKLLDEKLQLARNGETVYMDFDFYMIEELGATYIELFPTFEKNKVVAINMIVKELLDKDKERHTFEKVFLKFSQYSGQEFFLKTVKIMCESFGFDGAFVGHLSKEGSAILCDAAYMDKKYIEGFSYGLDNTPCQNVVSNNNYIFSDEILKLFPNDQFFINEKINTYCGMPVVSTQNHQIIGIINFVARRKMPLSYTFQKQLSLLAQRMTAEYERMFILNQLEQERAKTFIDANYETLGIMCGTLAHEIKNPLTIIKGYSEQILKTYRNTGIIGEKEIDKLEKVVKVNAKISALIDSLQNYSKQEQEMAPCLISSLINDSYLLIQMSLEDKKIPFAIEAYDRSLEIECLPGQIQQVLVNLIRNAIEAQTKNNNDSWISLQVIEDSESLSFVIQDNGCGFPPEVLNHQRDALFNISSVGQNYGLGLTYAKRVVLDHGGQLTIESLNSPTSVRVTLPKKQAKTIQESKKAA
jgi:signal transduction histidine kinase